MPTVLDTTLLTADEFLRLQDGGAATELVRGKIVEMNRPYSSYGYLMMRAAFLIQQYLQQHDIGRVGGANAGVVTERDPDTVRGPDVTFYSYERIPRGPLPAGYWPSTPELVLEIRSVDDRWKDIIRRAGEYLVAGVNTVAVPDPQTQRIHLLFADGGNAILNSDDRLTFPDILPGFSVPVKKLFESPTPQ
jgi:Uma2 family endonuclease